MRKRFQAHHAYAIAEALRTSDPEPGTETIYNLNDLGLKVRNLTLASDYRFQVQRFHRLSPNQEELIWIKNWIRRGRIEPLSLHSAKGLFTRKDGLAAPRVARPVLSIAPLNTPFIDMKEKFPPR